MRQIKQIYGHDYAPGYDLFTRQIDNFVSNGISWFESLEEQADFYPSHTLKVLNETIGIESSTGGVQWCNLSSYFDDPKIQVVCREPVDLDYPTYLEMYEAANKIKNHERQWYDPLRYVLGKHMGYDYTGLAGAALRITFKLEHLLPFLKKLPVPFHMPGTYYCSALISWLNKQAKKYRNISLYRKYHVTRITPAMLFNCEEQYKPFRLDKVR